VRKWGTVTVLCIVIALVFVFWPTDEKRIEKLFAEAAEAVENEDIDGVMEKVSFNYRDDYGFNYLSIKEAMKRNFGRAGNIGVEYENMEIQVQERASMAFVDVRVFATIGEETGYILGDAPDSAHLVFTLQKERTKWLIVKTEGLPGW
jgi:ketosteroid isomerase-like protein